MWKYVFIVVFCHGLVQDVFTLLKLFCHGFAQGELTLSKFKFQHKCGLRLHESVGVLEFDAVELPSNLHDNRCIVSIRPSSRHSQIMFYFENFDLSSNCEDTNLTITHGHWNVPTTTVSGLPNYMCGENRTLLKTDQNFIASKGKLIITYRFSEYGRRYPGSFSIKFLEFKTGKCYAKHERRCSDGHCVKKMFHCSDEIRACPVEDIDCKSVETADPIGVQLTHIVKNVGWIALAVIVFYLLRTCYRSNYSCVCELINGICKRTRRNSYDDDAARPSLETETAPVDGPTSPSEPEQTELSTPRHSSISSDRLSIEFMEVTSSDDDSSPFAQPNPSIPAAPPPSYDDVVAPSYDEVIDNEHRYQTSAH